MTVKKKPGTFPAKVKRRASNYWTTERIEAVLDYLIEKEGDVGVHEVAHYFRAGHDLHDENEYGACDRCGDDEYAADGFELLSALALRRDEAEAESKWAGLVLDIGYSELSDWEPLGPPLVFRPSRAAEWVAEQREAKERQRRRAEERSQVPDQGLGLLDAFWPEERLEVARGYFGRLLDAQDFARADELEYRTIPRIQKWQMMRVVAATPTRRVLTDYEGTVWVAAPIEDTTLLDDDANS